MAFLHRIPAIFAASFASCALGLLSISGVTQFLEIRAKDGHLLYIPDSTEPPMYTVTYLGVVSGSDLYNLNDNLMFILSRVCLFAAIAMGSFTCVLAWSLSSFISPTESNWKLLSVFAAISSVLQMPVFLLFETDPCSAYSSEQGCFLAIGSFYLILSTAFWIVVTVATQFMDPPRWADELNAWKNREAQQNRGDVVVQNSGLPRNDSLVDEESQAPLLKMTSRRKGGLVLGFRQWAQQRRWAASAELPKNQTDSLSVGEDEGIQETRLVEYEMNNTSALVLTVLPNGRRPGDDACSIRSFDDLDSLVKLAEEGRFECSSLAPPSRDASFATSEADGESDDHENRQLVVYQEKPQKQVSQDIYNDLEEVRPANETQVVVATTHRQTLNYSLPADIKENLAKNEAILCQESPEKLVKAPNVIRNFTENIKRRSRARRCQTNKYALMNDNDMESTFPVLPTEVSFHRNDSDSLPDAPGTPTKQACFDPRALTVMRKRSRSLDDDEYPDPIISYMRSHEDPSSSEDEPDPIISSTYSNEIDQSLVEATYDEDANSVYSSSSSESSSGDEYRHRVSSQDRQRVTRTRSRGYSSVRSVVSLIDTIIAEETDADLVEHGEPIPYDFVRSKSAPTRTQYRWAATDMMLVQEQVDLDDHASISTMGSSLFLQPSSADIDPYELSNIQLAPIISARRSLSLDRGYRSSQLQKMGSSVCSSGVSPTPLNLSLDTEQEDSVLSFPSSGASIDRPMNFSPHKKTEPEEPSLLIALAMPPEQNSNPASSPFEAALRDWKEERNASSPALTASSALTAPETPSPVSASLQDWKERNASSPALTAPETPSPVSAAHDSRFQNNQHTKHQDLSGSFESEKSWKEERELRGGIHAAPIDDIDDSPSNQKNSTPCDVVREARIRRLQRQTEVLKRTRSRTQDPPARRYRPPPAMSSVLESLDLQLKELLRDVETEYAQDENSI